MTKPNYQAMLDDELRDWVRYHPQDTEASSSFFASFAFFAVRTLERKTVDKTVKKLL